MVQAAQRLTEEKIVRTGGSALEGESSIEGVKREVGKKLGIDLAEIMLKGAMMYEYEDVCHIGYSW